MAEKKKELKEYTARDVAAHNDATSTWIIIDDKIYDVTKFLEEHPGGDEVILEQAGLDATEAFNDVGHSRDAREMTEDYLIGYLRVEKLPEVVESDKSAIKAPVVTKKEVSWASIVRSSTWSNFLIPLAMSGIIYCLYRGFKFFFRY